MTARKVAIGFAVVVAAFVVVLAAIPLAFGDRITARVKAQVDSSVDARVAWRAASVSLIRGIPHATLDMNGVTIAGVRAFAGDTLLTLDRARLVLDLRSVISYVMRGKPVVVRELSFDRPRVRLRRLADGTANWNIAKPQPAVQPSTSRAVKVSLRGLHISDASVALDDRQSNLSASVDGLNESLSGDFSSDTFVLSTRTHADSVSATFAGVPYLRRVALDLAADVNADMRAHRFAFANDTIRLNKLELATSGSIVTASPDMQLDVTFSSPSTAFSEILSLIPTLYRKDFDRIQTSGTMSVSGRVHGAYGPKAFPALAIRAQVQNGTFRYPDLALPARDIALDLVVNNPGGHVDSTVVQLQRFHAVIGSRALDASLAMRTPVSDPDLDVRVTGSVDLADVARTVKLDSVSRLVGIVAANLATHARVSDMNARRYERVAASGGMQISRLAIESPRIPHPVSIDTAALDFTPQNARLTAFTAKIGSSDARATGSLENLLGLVLHKGDLRGRAVVTSDHFDLNEWKSKDKTTEVIPVPRGVDFTLDASAAHVVYGALTLANVKGTLEIRNQRVTMHDLSSDMLGGRVLANGYYDTNDPAKPAFNMSVGLTTLDIPSAFTSLTTVQQLAPIAKYAQGHLSGSLSLGGILGSNMTPVFTALTGKGDISTDSLVVHNSPLMQKLAGALSLKQLESPAIGALRASIDVADGRLHVKPFSVKAAGIDVTASGSNGIDQSLAYDLTLAVPRGGSLAKLAAKITGTFANPSISTNLAGTVAAATEAAKAVATQKVDSAVDAAKAKARAEAARLIAEAERQADTIRATAKTAADNMRREANARIDSLVSRATNPIAKLAAQKAADELFTQTNQKADKLVQAANARADSLVSQAKQKAGAPPDRD